MARDKLIKFLQIRNSKALMKLFDNLSDRIRVNIQKHIVSVTPVGEVNPLYGTSWGRESYGKHLFESWETTNKKSTTPSGKNYQISLYLNHPTVGRKDGNILDWVSRGTRPHNIPTDSNYALRVLRKMGVSGVQSYSLANVFYKGEEKIFADRINHPGSKDNPFFRTAKITIIKEIEEEIENIYKKVIQVIRNELL